MRASLLRGGADLPPQTCAKCGRRMVLGIVYAVMINGEKFRVCSFACEKALKEKASGGDKVMIPVEPFVSPAVGTREYNAVKKATKEKPTVNLQGICDGHAYYRVGSYALEVFTDPDGQNFIDCSCLAGTPPEDPETKLPTREAGPCYHVAAVLLFIAEKENECQQVKQR